MAFCKTKLAKGSNRCKTMIMTSDDIGNESFEESAHLRKFVETKLRHLILPGIESALGLEVKIKNSLNFFV